MPKHGPTHKRKPQKKVKGRTRAKAAQGGKSKKSTIKSLGEKASRLVGGNELELALDINRFRESASRGQPFKSKNPKLQSFLEKLTPNEMAQLQRSTEARQGIQQLFGPESTIEERFSGAITPGAALGFDVLKSIPVGGGRSLLENFAVLHDALTGSTAGRQIAVPTPGVTSTDQPGNIKATFTGLGQGIGELLGRPAAGVPQQDQPFRPSASIPRGKHGGTAGNLFAKADADGRSIPRIRAQVGGFAPVSGTSASTGTGVLPTAGEAFGTQTQRIQEIPDVDVSGLENIVSQLSRFQPGGRQQISALQSFQGQTPLGRETLDEILRSGLPTDVSGITEAARIRATQEFEDAQNTIGERLANLGLVSSSAQTAAVARERARLGERVGAAGLEAQVGAAEAAAARRAGATETDIRARASRLSALSEAGRGEIARSGQRLGGLGQAASAAATAARLPLEGPTTRAGLGAGLPSASAFPSTTGGPSAGPSQFPPAADPQQFGFTTGIGKSTSARKAVPTGGFGGFRRFGQHGGVVKRPSREEVRFENFLQNIGADLSKTRGAKIKATPGTQAAQDVNRMAALARLGGEDLARLLFNDPSLRSDLAAAGAEKFRDIQTGTGKFGPQNVAQFIGTGVDASGQAKKRVQGIRLSKKQREELGIDPSTALLSGLDIERAVGEVPSGAAPTPSPTGGIGRIRPGSRSSAVESDRSIGLDIRGPRGSRINRQFFQAGGPVQQDPILTPRAGAVPSPDLPQETGQLIPGILDPRRQFFEDGGGVAPGQDTGEDQVPALLRSEELVVTPELVEDIKSVNPDIPQPGLITALHQLAEQPLEFAEEEGEFVAAHGGTPQFSGPFFGGPIGGPPTDDFIGQLSLAEQIRALVGATPETEARLAQRLPDDPRFDAPPRGVSPGRAVPAAGLPGQELADPFIVPEFGGDTAIPAGDFRLPSFREEIGEAGERKFILEGGTPGTGRVGAAGIRAGLDPTRGLVTGGEAFAPGVARRAPGVAGRVEGTAAITDPATGLPVDFGDKQLSRLERAQRVADLTRAAITTDPVGGPDKQARMLRSLEIANREVDSSVNEIIQGQVLAIKRQELRTGQVLGQAKLNESVARTLAAEAQKVTAEGAFAKQLSEIAAQDPVVSQILNIFEVMGKLKDADPRIIEQLEAVLNRTLQSQGLELAESGFFAKLFGAPAFEVSQTQTEQGLPGEGQDELNSLMSRAEAGLSSEDFQRIMDFM